MSAKCTPTDTMSSTSTLASASDWYATRYSSGPIGVTSASVSAICTSSGGFCGASQIVRADTAMGSANMPASRRATRRRPLPQAHRLHDVHHRRERRHAEQQPHRARHLAELEIAHRERREGHVLALRHEDHAGDREHQHDGDRQQRVDRAVGEAVQQQSDARDGS